MFQSNLRMLCPSYGNVNHKSNTSELIYILQNTFNLEHELFENFIMSLQIMKYLYLKTNDTKKKCLSFLHKTRVTLTFPLFPDQPDHPNYMILMVKMIWS